MRTVYSVSQVNAYIRRMFEEDYLLPHLMVRGEVSNLKYHASGHIYFTLKDASGTLSCVMFAGRRRGLSFHMQEGDLVIVSGNVDVYERDGRYQLYAQQIIADGAGLLREQFERLRRQLEAEGLFDEAHKKPIPRFVRTLGVVTASTGAAIRDIIHVATRRNPYVQIILAPAAVQGEGAPESIVAAIHLLDRIGPDVIIVGRGGGSMEDLQAFNDERVARAVYECDTPVISAVGHEVDTVITDYTADLRAPTPSAAAELAVFEYDSFRRDLLMTQDRLTEQMERRLQADRQRTEQYRRHLRLLSPRMQLRDRRRQLALLRTRLDESMRRSVDDSRRRLERAGDPAARMRAILERDRHRLQLAAGRLEAHSPAARLAGGYGYVETAGRKAPAAPVRSVADLTPGQMLRITLRDGHFTAQVDEILSGPETAGERDKGERTDGRV